MNKRNVLTRSHGQANIDLVNKIKEMNDRGLSLTAEVGAIDQEKRTVQLAFSSEAEVSRWFGVEILDHNPASVRMARLLDKAAVLWNHNWNDQRGVVESATIDSDKKGRAVLRFSRKEKGDELFQDIVDGIVKHVSVGYRVHGLKLEEQREDLDVYRITDWEPYEISMVSVPADVTVGVGRSSDKSHEEGTDKNTENKRNNLNTKKGTQKMNKTLRDTKGNLVRAMVDEDGNIVEVLEVLEKAGEGERSAHSTGVKQEQERVRQITDLGKQYDQRDLSMDFIGNGKSPEEFQRALLDKMAERNNKPMREPKSEDANIGLSDNEVRDFSLFRAVRALLPNASQKDREAAAFEMECSRAAEQQYGKEARGILIPQDVLDRAFNAGGAANVPAGSSSGSNIVATHLLTGNFIDLLRNKTTIMRLAQTMGGLVGNVEIPRQVAGSQAYWLGEHENAKEGSPTLGQIALTPRTVAAYTDISRKLMMQSTPDAENIARNDLVNAIAQAIDIAGYYGDGQSNQPTGIKNYTGINAVEFLGDSPTYEELVQMESEISADNADVSSMAYVMNARARGSLKTTQKFSGTNGAPVWEQGNTVNGYMAEVSNQIQNGDFFFGNFSDLIAALWGGLDLTVDPYSLSQSGGTRLVVFQDVDFALRRVESFCYGKKKV